MGTKPIIFLHKYLRHYKLIVDNISTVNSYMAKFSACQHVNAIFGQVLLFINLE